MADNNLEGNDPQTDPAGSDPKDTESKGTDSQTDPAGNAGKEVEGSEDIEDKHGHPGISAGKYARDMKAKDDEIAELKSQIAKAAETKEGREGLEAKIQKLEQDQADMKLDYELKLAGCVNTKAAKAILEDFDGDITKLKEGAPFLFEQPSKKGATGIKPAGSPDTKQARLEEARKVAGIRVKE